MEIDPTFLSLNSNDSIPPDIQLQLHKANRRREEFDASPEDYIARQAEEIFEDFISIWQKHGKSFGKEFPSAQRHFMLEDNNHRGIYCLLASKLGLFSTPQEALDDLGYISERTRQIAEATPSDKVAVVKHIHNLELPGLANAAVIVADHLNNDEENGDIGAKYAVSIEPVVVFELTDDEVNLSVKNTPPQYLDALGGTALHNIDEDLE